jgi:hypothetical protein
MVWGVVIQNIHWQVAQNCEGGVAGVNCSITKSHCDPPSPECFSRSKRSILSQHTRLIGTNSTKFEANYAITLTMPKSLRVF